MAMSASEKKQILTCIQQNKSMQRNRNSSKTQSLPVLAKFKFPRTNSKQRPIEPLGKMSSDLSRDDVWSLLHCGQQWCNTRKTLLLTEDHFCLMTVFYALLQNCEEEIKNTKNVYRSSTNMPISPYWSGKCKPNSEYSLQIPLSLSSFSDQFFGSPFFFFFKQQSFFYLCCTNIRTVFIFSQDGI